MLSNKEKTKKRKKEKTFKKKKREKSGGLKTEWKTVNIPVSEKQE